MTATTEQTTVTEAATRRVQIGYPTRRGWEFGEVPADDTINTTLAIVTRAEWLKQQQRQTIEAWDITDPAMPTLIAAWPGSDDRMTYEQLCKFTLGALNRGFRADTTRRGPDTGTPEGTAAIRQMQRFTLWQQRQKREGLYAEERVQIIDEMARAHLAKAA